MYYHAKKMARRVLIFNFGGISNSGFRARHISVVAGKRPKLLDNSQSKHIFTWKIAKKVQRVLDIEIFKSHLQKIFLTVFLLRLYALDNFWVISPVGVLLISANYAAKNRRAQRWNRLQ